MMREFTEQVKNITEDRETVYKDILQPAVQEGGKAIALIPRAINAALVPLRQWIVEREYKIAETERLLTQKLEHVNENKIVTPEAYIAVPAIQAISYSMNSEELRNLYANLLAKAMNVETKDLVHPSFIEIIKQMSPIDALIFKIVHESRYTPLIDLSIKKSNNGKAYRVYNINWITLYDHSTVSFSLDNLMRLKLIDIPSGPYHIDDSIYDIVRNTDFYIQTKKRLQLMSAGEVKEKLKCIQQTYLSSLFYKICIES